MPKNTNKKKKKKKTPGQILIWQQLPKFENIKLFFILRISIFTFMTKVNQTMELNQNQAFAHGTYIKSDIIFHWL